MAEITEKTIDVHGILASKMGDKVRYVPGFVVRWLERILHQDEFNAFIWRSRDKVAAPWLEECMKFLETKLEVRGMENLPSPDDARRYTFVSNHPMGGVEGVALGALIGTRYNNNFRYLVNDILMNLPGLAPLCIPINKVGKQGRNFPEIVRRGFAGDNHVMMFPAGICSRIIDGKIQDIPWTKTFVQKSVETQRDIVPIHFDGYNSPRFYRIARLCKLLHLKVNIAMIFLPDEMLLNRGKTFTVTIGKPIPWQTFDRSRNAKGWAQWVRARVYELPAEGENFTSQTLYGE